MSTTTIKKKERVTIKHVATHAGVSRAAVYAVLNKNNSTNIGISEATRQKVTSAISELGYIPNEPARTLASGVSKTIGMILQDSDTEMARHLCESVWDKFLARGYMVIPTYSSGDEEKERKLLINFLSKNIDCLILARLRPSANQDVMKQYEDFGIPVINISKDIAFNEKRVMELAVDHAVKIGAESVGYLGFNKNLLFSSRERLANMHTQVEKHSGLVFNYTKEISSFDECKVFASNLSEKKERPDVIVCYNDRLAGMLIVCLQLVGLNVPEDIGVIGIDGVIDPFLPVKLTSVSLPIIAMAEAIWSMFDSHCQNHSRCLIEPELIIGQSTK